MRRAVVGVNMVLAAAICATFLGVPIAYGDPQIRAAVPELFPNVPLYVDGVILILLLDVAAWIIKMGQVAAWGRAEALPAYFFAAVFFLLFGLFGLILSITGLFTDAIVGNLPKFGVFSSEDMPSLAWFLRAILACTIGQGYLLRCLSFKHGFDGDGQDGDDADGPGGSPRSEEIHSPLGTRHRAT
ncbi:MAG TPA: hypothetical protein VFG83_01770 [Kofleriaceae bacterium]|nr:hypothetical protein [Kofleriaceae bacterium]